MSGKSSGRQYPYYGGGFNKTDRGPVNAGAGNDAEPHLMDTSPDVAQQSDEIATAASGSVESAAKVRGILRLFKS